MKTVESEIYGNCVILAPDGEQLARCKYHRIEWYMSHGLADMVSENPPTIKLKFEPAGRGASAFDLANKLNRCVVCGSWEKLTRHHCVPKQFRVHMPDEIKNNNCHDVLPICGKCHELYEPHAFKLRLQISEEFGLSLDPAVIRPSGKQIRLQKAAYAVLHYGDQMPKDRRSHLIMNISEIIGHGVHPEELPELAAINTRPKLGPNGTDFGLEVVKRIPDLQAFIVRWRRHFLDCMNPQFMPEFWSVDSPI